MADGSIAASDNDDSEDGDEGEDGEEDAGSDHPASPTRASHDDPLILDPPPNGGSPLIVSEDADVVNDANNSLPLSETGDKPSSSLLAVSSADIDTTPSLEAAPTTSIGTPLSEVQNAETKPDIAAQLAPVEEAMQTQIAETAPSPLPLPPPNPTDAEVESAVQERQEEEEEEQMLLDIVQKNNEEPDATETQPFLAPGAETSEAQADTPVNEAQLVPEASRVDDMPGPPEPQPEAAADDDDDFPDLLGGLEKSLEKPAVQVPPIETIATQIVEATEATSESTKEE